MNRDLFFEFDGNRRRARDVSEVIRGINNHQLTLFPLDNVVEVVDVQDDQSDNSEFVPEDES